ncbi:Trm112 family protein [Myxococcus stipitatus]|uniref:Trm112 family protein n=1 Tax=Myxococcus stipitatus TaxID=83455 RepID=UPI0031450083
MPVPDSGWLTVLGCPRCKGRLTPHVVEQGLETLRCEPCRCEWPVEDGVPHLLPELGRKWDSTSE